LGGWRASASLFSGSGLYFDDRAIFIIIDGTLGWLGLSGNLGHGLGMSLFDLITLNPNSST
jgi:hypothetical protein